MLNLRRTLGTATLLGKKYAPDILFVTGMIGFVGTVVLACRATLNSEPILDKHQNTIDRINEESNIDSDFSEEQKQQLTTVANRTMLKEMIRLYAPSVGVGVVSMVCLGTSHKMIKDRYLAMASAYMAANSALENLKQKTLPVSTEGGENKMAPIDQHGYSTFAKCFDETNPNWEKDAESNRFFLQTVENTCNDKLKVKGHLFLNEVYEALGFEPTKAGQLVGWIYDPKNPVGDNFVDFGIFTDRQSNHDFVNGYERSIWLDFNVDGNILDFARINET